MDYLGLQRVVQVDSSKDTSSSSPKVFRFEEADPASPSPPRFVMVFSVVVVALIIISRNCDHLSWYIHTYFIISLQSNTITSHLHPLININALHATHTCLHFIASSSSYHDYHPNRCRYCYRYRYSLSLSYG